LQIKPSSLSAKRECTAASYFFVAFSGARFPRFAGTLWHGRSCDDRDNGPAISRAEEKL
jgi:hypothetical protein